MTSTNITLSELIELHRALLAKAYQRHGSLTHPAVVAQSQALDHVLTTWYYGSEDSTADLECFAGVSFMSFGLFLNHDIGVLTSHDQHRRERLTNRQIATIISMKCDD